MNELSVHIQKLHEKKDKTKESRIKCILKIGLEIDF